jgi:hypothetical protein
VKQANGLLRPVKAIPYVFENTCLLASVREKGLEIVFYLLINRLKNTIMNPGVFL